MKIHIMTDMEGCAGVMSEQDYIYSGSKYYEEARELTTLEVSAAVEGALEAGATEVFVVDGHGPGAIKRQLLHPRAKLLGGRPYPPGMASFGCDGTFAASMIIGQHAKANTDGGHLCHTMSFSVEEYDLNGMSIGELGLWLCIAGYYNVPVIMVSGDQAACEEARSLVPNIEVAAVKYGIKRGSATGLTKAENGAFNALAVHMHPNESRALIREHAYRAVKRIPEIAPFRLEAPYALTMAYRPEPGKTQGCKVTIKAADLMDLVGRQRQVVTTAIPKEVQSKPAAKPKPVAKPKPAAKPKPVETPKPAAKLKPAAKKRKK